MTNAKVHQGLRDDKKIEKHCSTFNTGSINQFYFIFVQISIHRNKLHSSGQKKETMAKRYTLIHAHEKNLD